jgi:hypothetical protein
MEHILVSSHLFAWFWYWGWKVSLVGILSTVLIIELLIIFSKNK